MSLELASDITRHERENEDDREADMKQTVQQREAGAVGSESGAAFQIWRIAAQNSLSIDYDRHRPSPIVHRPLMRMAAQARLPAPSPPEDKTGLVQDARRRTYHGACLGVRSTAVATAPRCEPRPLAGRAPCAHLAYGWQGGQVRQPRAGKFQIRTRCG